MKTSELEARTALLETGVAHVDNDCTCSGCMYLAGFSMAIEQLRDDGFEGPAARLDGILRPIIARVRRPKLRLVDSGEV